MGSQEDDGLDFKTPSMEELLRISLKLSDKEAMHEAALEKRELSISKEDQEWLKEVMGMKEVCDADRMKEALAVINDTGESQERKEYALDLILFAIEDMDNACDFVKFDGGLATLLRLLDDRNATMRLGAAWLLGTLTQNNPKAQAAVLGTGEDIAVKLMALTVDDPQVEVQRKALLALSSLARNSEAGQAAFLAAGGATLPAKLLGSQAPDRPLQKRSLFLAAHLIGESPTQFLSPFSDTKLASLCCELIGASSSDELGSEDLDLREHALLLLLELSRAGAEQLQAECGERLRAALLARAAQVGALEVEEKEWRDVELEMGQQLLSLMPGVMADSAKEAEQARLARLAALGSEPEPDMDEPDEPTPQSSSFTTIGQQCYNGATTARGLIVSHRHSQDEYHAHGDFVDVFDPESGCITENVGLAALGDLDLLPPSQSLGVISNDISGKSMRTRDLLREAIVAYADRPMVGMEVDEASSTRGAANWRWVTWKEIGLRAENLARALQERFPPHTFLGICALNSTDWVVAWMAVVLADLVAVPFHATATGTIHSIIFRLIA